MQQIFETEWSVAVNSNICTPKGRNRSGSCQWQDLRPNVNDAGVCPGGGGRWSQPQTKLLQTANTFFPDGFSGLEASSNHADIQYVHAGSNYVFNDIIQQEVSWLTAASSLQEERRALKPIYIMDNPWNYDVAQCQIRLLSPHKLQMHSKKKSVQWWINFWLPCEMTRFGIRVFNLQVLLYLWSLNWLNGRVPCMLKQHRSTVSCEKLVVSYVTGTIIYSWIVYNSSSFCSCNWLSTP